MTKRNDAYLSGFDAREIAVALNNADGIVTRMIGERKP
jgi:hypothetical protein